MDGMFLYDGNIFGTFPPLTDLALITIEVLLNSGSVKCYLIEYPEDLEEVFTHVANNRGQVIWITNIKEN